MPVSPFLALSWEYLAAGVHSTLHTSWLVLEQGLLK